jgi:hypothetical protein
MVTFRNLSRFFSRNSAGKEQLDVGQIRTAFTASEGAGEKLRAFRLDRLARIVANETLPLPETGAKLILHLIPYSALDPSAQVDTVGLVSRLDHLNLFLPLYGSRGTRRLNFDGALVLADEGPQGATSAYTLVFRSGAIEGADTALLNWRNPIPGYALERAIIEALQLNLQLASALGVGLPVFVALALLGVKDMKLGTPETSAFVHPVPFDRDNLILPELRLETFDVSPASVLKPLFDTLWNASNCWGSPYYDENGERR